MHTQSIFPAALVCLTLTLGLASPALAQQSSAAFTARCKGQVEVAQTLPQFEAAVDAAEAAVARGDGITAFQLYGDAPGYATSYAGYTGPLAAKCFGSAPYRRWYLGSKKMLIELTDKLPGAIDAEAQVALWTAANGGGTGAAGVLDSVPVDANRWRGVYIQAGNAVNSVTGHRDAGAFVLKEEAALADTGQAVIDLINTRTAEFVSQELANEDAAFNRAATAEEQAMMAQVKNISALANDLTGIDSGAQTEYQLTRQRVQESTGFLGVARAWNFTDDSKARDNSSLIASRAGQRSDEIVTKGNATSLSFTHRDSYLKLALRYLDLCECQQRADTIAARRAAIQPDLLAEQARQDELRDQKKVELKSQAESMQQAVKDMQKTEAEKQSFKDEADAMEAELGF